MPRPTPLRSIVVSVGFDDLLSITLPRNARHVDEVLVVTHPDDQKTKQVAKRVSNARIFETDAFYRDGASFNKGLALAEAYEALPARGWILSWDADTLWPDQFNLPELQIGRLYGAQRVILNNPKLWNPDYSWQSHRAHVDKELAGYFQLFHASDPALAVKPWFRTHYQHAGGFDGEFQGRWHERSKAWLPFKVLHLGAIDSNWAGRTVPRLDDIPIPEAAQRLKEMHELKETLWGSKAPKTGKPFWNRDDYIKPAPPVVPPSAPRPVGQGPITVAVYPQLQRPPQTPPPRRKR